MPVPPTVVAASHRAEEEKAQTAVFVQTAGLGLRARSVAAQLLQLSSPIRLRSSARPAIINPAGPALVAFGTASTPIKITPR